MDTTVPAAEPAGGGVPIEPFPTVVVVFVEGVAGAPIGGVEEGLHVPPQMISLIAVARVSSWPEVLVTVATIELEVADTLLQLEAPPQVGTNAPALI